MEFGGAPSPDTTPVQDWEYSATSFTELADRMGCA
jgi:2-haloacid dehalogenase